MPHDLSELSRQLHDMSLGQRAWFWMCPGLAEVPLLILSPFREDPLMRTLKATVAGLRIPAGIKPTMGLCLLDEDGVFRFASQTISVERLAQLAEWVRDNASEYPALRRLYGAQFALTDVSMRVLLMIKDPSLWAGVVPISTPGTLEEAVQTIYQLPPGTEAWFWATDRGPANRPLLLVHPIAKTADITQLNQRVEGALRRTTDLGATVRGIIGCGPGGALRVHTQTKPKRARPIFRALGKTERHLRWMLQPRALPEDNLSKTADFLGSLKAMERGWFIILNRAREGELVLAAPSRDDLRRQAQAFGVSPRQGSLGQLRVRSTGQIDLVTKAVDPSILPTVGRWIAQHRSRYPGIDRLIGARLVVLGDDGNPSQRVEDERVWAAL